MIHNVDLDQLSGETDFIDDILDNQICEQNPLPIGLKNDGPEDES